MRNKRIFARVRVTPSAVTHCLSRKQQMIRCCDRRVTLVLANGCRFATSPSPKYGRRGNRNVVLYSTAGVLAALAGSYAAVPLYRIYCQQTGKGGKAFLDASEKVSSMKPIQRRRLTIRFEADTESRMAWDFKPLQTELTVVPGETALAFYTAFNPREKPVTGISTYTVQPLEAGIYLNKIQCFCFEEQRLNPKEQVDMPVFFYIDPEYAEDPRLENVDSIVLSYVFFESKEGVNLPFMSQVEKAFIDQK